MNRSERILHQLESELGFSCPLVGGRKSVLAQIDRFLTQPGFPESFDRIEHPQLWSRLIAEVVVPETSFFRYPESFVLLREWVRSRVREPLRVLCLPCSTGEEAYSVAITLREAGIISFQIDAFDVSAKSLAIAAAGRYPVRSIRGLPEVLRKQWFQHDGKNLVAADSLRAPIRFDIANVFTLDLPQHGFEIIFCRNLLIYFDADKQTRIFERLRSWLTPGGLLLLGPGEATTAASHGWKGTGHTMSFSFVSSIDATPTIRPAAALPKPPPARYRTRSPSPRKPRSSSPPSIEALPDTLANAELLADAGRLEEAAQVLCAFHQRQEATAASLFLRGILEESQGQPAAAEASYRKSLYLEPDHLDALLHLSLLLEGEGRAPAAAPLRRRIDRLSATS